METFNQNKDVLSPVGDFINPSTGEVEFTSSDIHSNEEVKKYIEDQIGDNINDKIDYISDTKTQEIVYSANPIPQVPGQIVMPGFAESATETDTDFGDQESKKPSADEDQPIIQEPAPADNPEETDPDENAPKVYKYKSSQLEWVEKEAEKTGQSYITVLLEHGIDPGDVDPDK